MFEKKIYIYELFLFVSLPGKHFCHLRTAMKAEFNKENITKPAFLILSVNLFR